MTATSIISLAPGSGVCAITQHGHPTDFQWFRWCWLYTLVSVNRHTLVSQCHPGAPDNSTWWRTIHLTQRRRLLSDGGACNSGAVGTLPPLHHTAWPIANAVFAAIRPVTSHLATRLSALVYNIPLSRPAHLHPGWFARPVSTPSLPIITISSGEHTIKIAGSSSRGSGRHHQPRRAAATDALPAVMARPPVQAPHLLPSRDISVTSPLPPTSGDDLLQTQSATSRDI